MPPRAASPCHAIRVPGVTRRHFLRSAASVGGGLMLGIHLPIGKAVGQENAPASAAKVAPPRAPSAFLHIAPDDTITLVSPSVEMGQGGHTALPMILMEELGGDWKRLKVEDAPAAAIFNNPLFGVQLTAGSFSVRGWYTELRRTGAAGREMLISAAAKQWGVPAAECAAADSVITHARSGRTCTYGSVASAAAALPVPAQPLLKTGGFTLIGTSPLRVDVANKVDGSARYGIDVKLPGMLYASTLHSPVHSAQSKIWDPGEQDKSGAAPESWNDAQVRAMKGVIWESQCHGCKAGRKGGREGCLWQCGEDLHRRIPQRLRVSRADGTAERRGSDQRCG